MDGAWEWGEGGGGGGWSVCEVRPAMPPVHDMPIPGLACPSTPPTVDGMLNMDSSHPWVQRKRKNGQPSRGTRCRTCTPHSAQHDVDVRENENRRVVFLNFVGVSFRVAVSSHPHQHLAESTRKSRDLHQPLVGRDMKTMSVVSEVGQHRGRHSRHRVPWCCLQGACSFVLESAQTGSIQVITPPTPPRRCPAAHSARPRELSRGKLKTCTHSPLRMLPRPRPCCRRRVWHGVLPVRHRGLCGDFLC